MKKTIIFDGPIVGLNQYKSLSWQKLKSKIDFLKFQLIPLIKAAKVPKLLYLELRVKHNTRFDLDNLTGTIKVFVDLLRKEGIIEDDTKRFFDYLSIEYDPSLKKKNLYFEIHGEVKAIKKPPTITAGD
jgi:Holliday junction resolvase RusA-like endonuclease